MDDVLGRPPDARHGLDGHNDLEIVNGGSRLRRGVAVGMIWAGRAVLLLTPVAVIGCRLTKQRWVGAPLDAGVSTHWIPTTTMLLLVIFGIAAPLLFFPVTSPALTRSEAGCLQASTVLGTRRVELRGARVSFIYIPGRGPGLRMAVLRDRGHRHVIVAASELWIRNDLKIGSTRESNAGWRSKLLPTLGGVLVLLGDVLIASAVLTVGPGLAGIFT